MKKHLLFFIFVIGITTLYLMSEFPDDEKLRVVYVLTFVASQFFVYFLNIKFLLPKIYEPKRYFIFSVVNILIVFLASLINLIVEDGGFSVQDHFDLEDLFAHSVPCILAVLIAFAVYTYQKKLEQEEMILEIVKAEKSFLLQQINPHFMFNALNNIYSITLENNPKGAEAILQLSKMLDYSLYGSNQETVCLKKEVHYIQNFIYLFKLKDDEIENISFTFNKADLNQKIAPMLLLPFVENAFKHGNLEDVNNGFVNIEIASEKNRLIFTCTNSYATKQVDKVGGIGINNVSRRLELLYANTHKLNIEQTERTFSVTLELYV